MLDGLCDETEGIVNRTLPVRSGRFVEMRTLFASSTECEYGMILVHGKQRDNLRVHTSLATGISDFKIRGRSHHNAEGRLRDVGI